MVITFKTLITEPMGEVFLFSLDTTTWQLSWCRDSPKEYGFESLFCNHTQTCCHSPAHVHNTGKRTCGPHPEVGAEDVRVAPCHQQDALDALAQHLRGVQVLQDGLQAAHHQLGREEDRHNTEHQSKRHYRCIHLFIRPMNGLWIHFTHAYSVVQWALSPFGDYTGRSPIQWEMMNPQIECVKCRPLEHGESDHHRSAVIHSLALYSDSTVEGFGGEYRGKKRLVYESPFQLTCNLLCREAFGNGQNATLAEINIHDMKISLTFTTTISVGMCWTADCIWMTSTQLNSQPKGLRRPYLHYWREGLLLPHHLQGLVGGHQVQELDLVLGGGADLEEDPLKDPLGLVAERGAQQAQASSRLLTQLL